MVARFLVRWRTAHPPSLTPDRPPRNRIASLRHYGFSVFVLLTAGTGMATALPAKLKTILFAGSGDPLPVDLRIYPTREACAYLAAALYAFIVLHLAAVGHRQPSKRDGVSRRPFFGRR